MKEIIKIVLTGGPCAGKSTALDFLKTELEKVGENVLTLSECATNLIKSGKTPENMGSYAFHSLLFATQLESENKLIDVARSMNHDRVIIICDRGLLDNRAYVTSEEFKKYSAAHGYSEEKIRVRYDAVFHMVTAADGAEEDYNFESNEIRSEDVAKAKWLDNEILSLWTGVNHLRIIDNSTDFNNKLSRLLQEVLAFIGNPEPLEIERKFLIEMPDLNFLQSIKTCCKIPITQAYMNTPDEGIFRIRKRGDGENALYIKTVKRKISDIKRIEIENYISEKEYCNYISQKEYIKGVISKDRYCIALNSTYYELDVYPFWHDKATLEIELLSEKQKYVLPDFIKLIKEVTYEKEYRNKALSVRYSDFFTP